MKLNFDQMDTMTRIAAVLNDMKINITDAFLVNDLDGMDSRSAMTELLDQKICNSMVIFGDWKISASKGIDVYDVASNFAEDYFKRIRSQKSEEYAWYLVVVSDRIEKD